MAIDYERMKRVGPKHKAALTRAKKKGYDAVRAVCRAAVREWDEIGSWPDNANIFQIALDDARIKCLHENRVFIAPLRLEEL